MVVKTKPERWVYRILKSKQSVKSKKAKTLRQCPAAQPAESCRAWGQQNA